MDAWRRPAEARKLIAAVAALVAASGCGDDEDEDRAQPAATSTAPATEPDAAQERVNPIGPTESTAEYVGRLSGDQNTYVSVTTLRPADGEGRNLAVAYLCDSKNIAELFIGPLRGEGRSTAFSRLGGNVALQRSGDKFLGNGVLGDGTKVSFVASEVGVEDPAGFYIAYAAVDDSFEGQDYGAWIVLPDGSQRGAIRQAGTLGPAGTLNVTTSTATAGTRTITPSSGSFRDGTC